MAEKTIPIKGSAYTFVTTLVSQADPMTYKATPTLSAGDVKVDKDGAGLTNLTDLPTASGKLVTVSLSAAEMNADEVTIVFSDAAGAEWCDLVIVLHPSSATIGNLATPATVMASVVEGTVTLQQALRLVLAAVAGKASGGGTTTITFRDTTDSTNRIVATVDNNGNRSVVTLDPS